MFYGKKTKISSENNKEKSMKLSSIFFKAVAFFTLIVFTMVACSSPFGNSSGAAAPPRITTIDPFALFVDIEGNVVDNDTGRTIVIADEDLNVLIYTDNIAGSSTQRVAFVTDDASVIFYFERNQNFPSMVVLSDDEGDVIGYFTPYNSSTETFGLIFVNGEEKEVFLDIPFSREILNFTNDRELTASQNLRMRNLNVAMYLIIAMDEVLDLDDDTARSVRRWLRRAIVVVAVVAVVAVAVVAIGPAAIAKGAYAAGKWAAKKAVSYVKKNVPKKVKQRVSREIVYQITGLDYRAAIVNAVLGGGTVVAPSPPAGGGGGMPPALPPAGGGGGGGGGSGAPPAQPALTGTVRITGTPQVGQTLTANTAGLGGSGAINFQWRRGTTNVGTNSNTHVVQAADEGTNITVTVTRAGHSGSVTSPVVGPVTPAPMFGISLNVPTNHVFASLQYGYDADSLQVLTVRVANTGNQPTGYLNIALSGANADSFTLSRFSIPSIYAGGSETFTIVPNTALAVGAYVATVTISGADISSRSFGVSFAVTAQIPYRLVFQRVGNEYHVTGRNEIGGAINIPATHNGLPVTAIGADAFRNNRLTNVVIPSSVTYIGIEAFIFNDLISVTIPNSVTHIGNGAFRSNNLTSLLIPDNVTHIGTSAFRNNSLASVTIPSNATRIENEIFADNNLVNVSIPANVTQIGIGAFRNNSLTSVTIPDGVTRIESEAFSSNNLTSVIIPDSVTHIGIGAFSSNSLTSVTLSNSVSQIEMNAFLDNNLTNVTIPNGVTQIGLAAFASNNLISVTIPDSVTRIESQAFRHNSLTSVIIPGSVTHIGTNAFSDNNLTNVTIQNGVARIENEAFADNNLASVTIPGSVSFIGTMVFFGNNLTSVTLPFANLAAADTAWNGILWRLDMPSDVNWVFAP